MATMSDAEKKKDLLAKISEIHQRETQALDFREHHREPRDNQHGQGLSVRQELTWLREQADKMAARLERIEALVTPKAPGS